MVTSNEDDLTRSKKLSWLLSSIYICDMSVLRLLSQISPSLSQYGESNQNHDAIQKSLVTPLFNMIDSIIVSSTSLRLSLLNWWLSTQALQVNIVHLIRNPSSIIAEMIARNSLRGIHYKDEEIKSYIIELCQDYRDDLKSSQNLHKSRYIRIR